MQKMILSSGLKGMKKLARAAIKPIKKLKKMHEIKKCSEVAMVHYENIIHAIRLSGRKQLKFAAYVIFDSTYGMDGVFQLMMAKPEQWNPKIVVIPDVSRGMEHARKTYFKTKEYFIKKYGSEFVIDGWNAENDEYIDPIDEFDVAYYANPYDDMVWKRHGIEYASTRNVLPIYVSYGYDVGRSTTISRLKGKELNLIWKLFADTTDTYYDYKKYQLIKGKNVTISGYSKMDEYARISKSSHDRKRILITPHHTITSKILPLSNFLKYESLITRLPELFPQVDFVFRPHPLLFTNLINQKLWTKEQADAYIEKLKEKGVAYSTGGDYLAEFEKCDALINDCGSFTIEWLFTGKPGCFVYNENLRKKDLTTLMNKAIKKHVIAKSEADVIQFINDVINGVLPNQSEMDAWFRENVALNYPKVSAKILNEIYFLGD